MIKTITDISQLSTLDQNQFNNIHGFKSVDFEEIELGSGGFGSVYNIISIDGKPVDSYVIKVFKDGTDVTHSLNTIHFLHKKLKEHQKKVRVPIFHEFPELIGLPFAAFKGLDEIEEKPVVCFLIYNLTKLGYSEYESRKSNSNASHNVSIPDKLYYCYSFAKLIKFLHGIKFIHSDISEDALWLNYETKLLSLIDFDSGYHFDKQSKPSTWGKIGHWISFGKYQSLNSGNKSSVNISHRKRIEEEYWVLASALFELLTGLTPFFFLTSADSKTKAMYLKRDKWPEVDKQAEYFNFSNTRAYNAMIDLLEFFKENGLESLIDSFSQVFNSGYVNEKERLSAAEWYKLLFPISTELELEPLISSFSSNKTEIYSNQDEIVFQWEVSRFNKVFLDGELMDIGSTSFNKTYNDTTTAELRVENDFGAICETIEVIAVKKPPIKIELESDTLIRDSEQPITIWWEFENVKEVVLTSTGEKFESIDSVKLEPTEKTTYIFEAVGLFGEILAEEITIDIVKPEIEEFSYEINLKKGLDNIDLYWSVINCESVEIEPGVGTKDSHGIEHVLIYESTEFTLKAVGLFTTVEKKLLAHAFSKPTINQISVKKPNLELSANIDTEPLKLPLELTKTNDFVLNNSIQLNEELLKPKEINLGVKVPEFHLNNKLIERYSKDEVSIGEIFRKVKKIIIDKLEKYEISRQK